MDAVNSFMLGLQGWHFEDMKRTGDIAVMFRFRRTWKPRKMNFHLTVSSEPRISTAFESISRLLLIARRFLIESGGRKRSLRVITGSKDFSVPKTVPPSRCGKYISPLSYCIWITPCLEGNRFFSLGMYF